QKTQMEAMEGVWIYELGELAGMRYTDVNKVKAFASRSVDKARPAYGRVAEVRKRRGILVGTTNDDQYLKDETGNRRFWPITTGKIDLASIAALRDQLWAEAAVREAQGEGIVLPEELWQSAAIEQGKRVPPDAWQEVLEAVRGDACRGREQITSRDLLMEVLNIPANQIDSFKSRRLARVMKVLGWTGPVTLTLRNGGKQKGYWRYTSRPDDRDAPI
ncbi:MAG: VapE domain-containing protein, partial [bacterium]